MPVSHAAKLISLTAVAAALSLAACSQTPDDGNLAELDNQITGNDADPALTSALEDQIMVDPGLTQQSNRNAVRTAAAPAQAQYPVAQGTGAPAAGRAAPSGAARSGGAAQVQASLGGDGAAGCGTDFSYDPSWAGRLPPAIGIYPGARVTEAAGNVKTNCRVVTFTSKAAPQQVLGWYRQRAVRAGYSAEQQLREGDHILAGGDGANGAYYLIVTPKQGGSDVALIANHGR